MIMKRLTPPLDLDTPNGAAIAEFIIDRGPHSHLEWICFIKDTGECWTFENPHIRLAKNITMGIRVKSVNETTDETRVCLSPCHRC